MFRGLTTVPDMALAFERPVDVRPALGPLLPVVLSSPHSGNAYPPKLLDGVRVGLSQLRRLEDAFVDQLFAGGPLVGAPLLRALFPRAYVDANREPFELDADLCHGPLPSYVNASSVKARAGLGTIPSRLGGEAIYARRLSMAEARARIDGAYWPYHQTLSRLLRQAQARCAAVVLLDCHSMPSQSTGRAGEAGIDVALGDRFGRSCAPPLIDAAEAFLRRRGLHVVRNRPYAGGYITAHYGRPAAHVHALQIEVRRSLYMDERALTPLPSLAALGDALTELVQALARVAVEQLAPPEPAGVDD